MIAHVSSFILEGIAAVPCEVEVDFDPTGMDKQTVVGLPDAAVRESIERVQAALTNTGYRCPAGRLLVNLAPADTRKEGPVYDLAIGLGLLIAGGVIEPAQGRSGMIGAREAGRSGAHRASANSTNGAGGAHIDGAHGGGLAVLEREPAEPEGIDLRRFMVAGELALDGRVRPVRGVIAMAALAQAQGMRGVIVPKANAREAAVVGELEVYGVSSLAEVVGLVTGMLDVAPEPPVDVEALIERSRPPVDFADVRGQETVKRAITVAAAGGHNILMLGPAGTGKTMMARALPGVLPPLTREEALEVTRIYSAVGRLGGPPDRAHTNAPGGAMEEEFRDVGLVTRRPVRAPHHTASSSAVIGGGAIPKPGEISLAHRGVLFLDELPEFPRYVLDTLRQPLEEGSVTIARAHSAVTFPARFMLVAAMNPTAKGDMPTDGYGRREMERYVGRLSRPLIDRVDIHVEAPAVAWSQLSGPPTKGTSTQEMRERVSAARERQHARQARTLNSALSGRQLDVHAPIEPDALLLLGQAMTELKLSARAYDKIRRVSRTIADLEGQERITAAHIAEAVQYRLLDRGV